MSNTGTFWGVILGGFFSGPAKVLSGASLDTLFGQDDLYTDSVGLLTLLKPGFEAFEQGVRGISIPFNVRLVNVLARKVEVGIFFVNQNGNTIKTKLSDFALEDETCAVGRHFTSNSYNMSISDQLFIPYGILDVNKTQEIVGQVYVHIDDKRKIALTKSFKFKYFVYNENEREYNSAPRVDELDAIIGLIAIVIRADGITAKEEIQTVVNFFQKKQNINLDLVRERLKFYLNAPPDLEDYCDKLRNIETQRRYIIVSLLLNISVSDGIVHPVELNQIHRISELFDIPARDFRKMKKGFISEKQKSFELLGLKMGVSESLILSAYKSKCKEFDPDQYQNLPKGMRDLAREHYKKIQIAFEILNN